MGVEATRRTIWKRYIHIVITVGVVFALGSSVGVGAESMEELDQRLTSEIKKQNQAAAALFVKSNEARAIKDHERAAEFYGRV